MDSGCQIASVIIPTHNRKNLLQGLLSSLAQQTFPLQQMEVIVVADNCSDGTIEMLAAYNAPFRLEFTSGPGMGAATARNTGALRASGRVLIFIDDDIDPSPGLVEAHLAKHTASDVVVIGYLPLPLEEDPGFYRILLRKWWEDEFGEFLLPGHRFSYRNLLSGNFSVSRERFTQAKGFDTSFDCREDYELGARLLKGGANFVFSRDAYGYHLDTETDLKRSLGRKRKEGAADVLFALRHPDLLPDLQISKYGSLSGKESSTLSHYAFEQNKVGDFMAGHAISLMHMLEQLKLRSLWQKLSNKVHQYWYLRGAADALKSRTALDELISASSTADIKSEALKINLKLGLPEAERILDFERPSAMQLFYGDQFIGEVKAIAGAEDLRGKHLRPIIAAKFLKEMSEALALDEPFKTHLSGRLTTKFAQEK
ncbi:glycosyltransferase [Segetibacter sp. 3557_3]|uniref:glycosyltransferase n=1 Tax=Segetibacter sp. 3557_3 TaxID=2547429 RepID=UPI0010585E5E|nr:glycosyltransferase family 2 protein [Segetibacter sp. 3557_3]TDH20817.1 glycosyltransferase [Segetibacter sp. 3557_3]